MDGVLTGFVTIGVLIGMGAWVAHLGILDLAGGRLLALISFSVASPALLLTTIAESDPGVLFTTPLLVSALAAGGTMLLYVVPARLAWREDAGSAVVGGFTTGYVNSANLGIPIATYVLGNAALVAPILLLQLIVIQPVGLAILDAQAAGKRPTLVGSVRTILTNPLTLATLAGVVLALTGWRLPELVASPIRVLAGFAIPAVLMAYGVTLRLGPGIAATGRDRLALTSALKLVIHPLLAFLAGRLLGLDGQLLFAVVVLAALPTAQNVFVIATRYDRAEILTRDTILLTTLGSVPVIALIALLLG